MAYEIEKGIKLPPSTRRRTSKYPWDQMKVGDSFFVPGKPKGLYTAASNHGVKIAVRPEKKGNQEGVRVWRRPDAKAKKRGRRKQPA